MPSNRIVSGFLYWDFISIKGYPDLPGQNLKTITKDGVDGRAYVGMEFSADPTPIYLHGFASTPAIRIQLISDMANLQGTQVDFYDAVGDLHPGVVIEKSRRTATRYVIKPSWGSVNYPEGWRMTFSMIVTNPYGWF